jgi:hypothetical protein
MVLLFYPTKRQSQPLRFSTRKIKTKMASLQPKNSGGPIAKFWDAQETIGGLEHVKGWLCKHAKKVSSPIQLHFNL